MLTILNAASTDKAMMTILYCVRRLLLRKNRSRPPKRLSLSKRTRFIALGRILFDDEVLYQESMWVLVAAGNVDEFTGCDEGSHGLPAVTRNGLCAVSRQIVGVTVEVAYYAVHFHRLDNIGTDDTPVIAGFQKVLIIVVGTLVGQVYRTRYIALYQGRIGGQREEILVKHTHMVAGFDRTVGGEVLLQGHDEGAAAIQHIYLFSFLFDHVETVYNHRA